MNPRKAIEAIGGEARVGGPDGMTVVEAFDAGELGLPTGRLVACDPDRMQGGFPLAPFARAVPPGRYPVRVCVARFPAGGRRVALAVLMISGRRPVRFEPAFRADDDPATFEDGEFPAHGVDTGTSCFADARTVEALAARCRDRAYLRDVFPGLFGMQTGTFWREDAVDADAGLNVIAFPSGFGDGAYASYWGFDALGEPACLVTDFGLLGRPTCPECDAEEGDLHRFLCGLEPCPFCGELIRSCACVNRVLALGADEEELLRRFDESFRLAPPKPGPIGWLASFFRPRPPSEPELAKIREIQKRWKRAADARGRIPFGTPDACKPDDEEREPTPTVETLVMMGSMELGRFNLSASPARADSGGPEPVRRLVMPPTWTDDRSVMVWNERRGDEDVTAVMWRPEDAAERAEAERLYAAARRRSWTTPEELRDLLDGPGPWLLRLNMFGVFKYLNENREEALFAPDSDEEEAPAVFEDDPDSGATFTREQVLDFVPRLWEEWLHRDEDYYFEPIRPEDAR